MPDYKDCICCASARDKAKLGIVDWHQLSDEAVLNPLQDFHDLLYQLYTALVSPFPCIPLTLVQRQTMKLLCVREYPAIANDCICMVTSCRRPYHRLLILSPPLCLMGPVLSRLHLRDSFLKTIPLVFGIGGPSTDGSLGPSQTKHWEVFRSALIRPSILTLCSLTSPLHHSSPICHQKHQCSLQ